MQINRWSCSLPPVSSSGASHKTSIPRRSWCGLRWWGLQSSGSDLQSGAYTQGWIGYCMPSTHRRWWGFLDVCTSEWWVQGCTHVQVCHHNPLSTLGLLHVHCRHRNSQYVIHSIPLYLVGHIGRSSGIPHVPCIYSIPPIPLYLVGHIGQSSGIPHVPCIYF